MTRKGEQGGSGCSVAGKRRSLAQKTDLELELEPENIPDSCEKGPLS